jgi:hypothetical protein
MVWHFKPTNSGMFQCNAYYQILYNRAEDNYLRRDKAYVKRGKKAAGNRKGNEKGTASLFIPHEQALFTPILDSKTSHSDVSIFCLSLNTRTRVHTVAVM